MRITCTVSIVAFDDALLWATLRADCHIMITALVCVLFYFLVLNFAPLLGPRRGAKFRTFILIAFFGEPILQCTYSQDLRMCFFVFGLAGFLIGPIFQRTLFDRFLFPVSVLDGFLFLTCPFPLLSSFLWPAHFAVYLFFGFMDVLFCFQLGQLFDLVIFSENPF